MNFIYTIYELGRGTRVLIKAEFYNPIHSSNPQFISWDDAVRYIDDCGRTGVEYVIIWTQVQMGTYTK